jgi:hypothetical protein
MSKVIAVLMVLAGAGVVQAQPARARPLPRHPWPATKILFPVGTDARVRGSNDSSFETTLEAYSDAAFDYYPCAFLPITPTITCTQPAHDPFLSIPCLWCAVPRIVFVSSDQADSITFGYYLLSNLGKAFSMTCPGASQTNFTELPVVHEMQFRTARLQLVGIPVRQSLRHTLRIIDVDSRGRQRFVVRLWITPTVRVEPDASETFEANTPGDVGDATYQATYPPFVELSLENEFQGLCFPRLRWCMAYGARIEVAPVDPTTRFWAFVSSTDNLTQQVTLTTPQ